MSTLNKEILEVLAKSLPGMQMDALREELKKAEQVDALKHELQNTKTSRDTFQEKYNETLNLTAKLQTELNKHNALAEREQSLENILLKKELELTKTSRQEIYNLASIVFKYPQRFYSESGNSYSSNGNTNFNKNGSEDIG